jgi:hypothetical protein
MGEQRYTLPLLTSALERGKLSATCSGTPAQETAWAPERVCTLARKSLLFPRHQPTRCPARSRHCADRVVSACQHSVREESGQPSSYTDWATGRTIRGSNPCRVRRLFSSRSCPDRLCEITQPPAECIPADAWRWPITIYCWRMTGAILLLPYTPSLGGQGQLSLRHSFSLLPSFLPIFAFLRLWVPFRVMTPHQWVVKIPTFRG